MIKVYALSDSIGETAELVALASCSQFKEDIEVKRVPYVKSFEDVEDFLKSLDDFQNTVIICTIVLSEVREFLINRCIENNITIINILSPIMNVISSKTKSVPVYNPGAVWKMDEDYFKRIEAMEFAIQYDDSKDLRGLKNADIILVGLSRTSKTPLSLYLANKGYKTINIPLVPEVPIPEELFTIDKSKVFGLTINPLNLIDIRKHRLDKFSTYHKSISYADEGRILEEFDFSDKIIKKLGCKSIDVTNRALEDTALIIMNYINQ
ncbi:pyruvate, water dikinase regulatory protein [Clostridium hydrogeniformans]|uniref:pyruvate, water dikinase regulatory protein n=1 Tax=Clostridium hydrogeniformans TaxID=349933 RepID=UPI00048374A5|nr:pyruvate, water dikinase regulatory protein [Clostridium hydrogeniformans]